MKIEPSGVVMTGECEIRTPYCTALRPAPITAVWGDPGRRQIDVCGACLEEMVRRGEWEVRGAKISRKYDLAVYDRNNRLQLVVEVKDYPYRIGSELENWAARIRRNLMVHSGIPSYVYFLLAVYPAPFYLWGKEDAPEAKPRFSFDVQNEMPRLHESRAVSDYQQQEGAVHSWLKILIETSAAQAGQTERNVWLHDSGLYEAIRGGTIVKQASRVESRELQAV